MHTLAAKALVLLISTMPCRAYLIHPGGSEYHNRLAGQTLNFLLPNVSETMSSLQRGNWIGMDPVFMDLMAKELGNTLQIFHVYETPHAHTLLEPSFVRIESRILLAWHRADVCPLLCCVKDCAYYSPFYGGVNECAMSTQTKPIEACREHSANNTLDDMYLRSVFFELHWCKHAHAQTVHRNNAFEFYQRHNGASVRMDFIWEADFNVRTRLAEELTDPRMGSGTAMNEFGENLGTLVTHPRITCSHCEDMSMRTSGV